MRETERTRKALAEGRAVLRYIVSDEAWYGHVLPRERGGPVHELSIGVAAVTAEGDDDGTYGEGAICWYELEPGRSWSAKLEMFHDAWAAFGAVPGFWDALVELGRDTPGPTPAEVRAALGRLGFVDKTERRDPNFMRRGERTDRDSLCPAAREKVRHLAHGWDENDVPGRAWCAGFDLPS